MIRKLEVYDPPMCCSTGVCGPLIDPKLVRFAADLEWLQRKGVAVERYNLAQQPDAFVRNASLQEAMGKDGTDCLPLCIADGKIVARGHYPERRVLAEIAGLQDK